MSDKPDKARFGINIKQYCREHEAQVHGWLEDGSATPARLARHAQKIRWLQHERLIHLMVVFIFSLLFLFSVAVYILLTSLYALILMAVTAAVLIVYIRHYFILENTVQRWYMLYDQLDSLLR